MTDPTRARLIDLAGPAPELQWDEPSPNATLLIETKHATKPGTIDFSEFAVGGGLPGKGKRVSSTFRGRPQLIRALAPEIEARFQFATILTLKATLAALRSFWRFLDTVDGIAPVELLSELQDLHGTLWLRAGCDPVQYALVKSLVAEARVLAGMPAIFWPPMPERLSKVIALPDTQHVRSIYHELKFRVRALFTRWTEADRLAAEGTNRIGQIGTHRKSHLDQPDIHASFRAALRLVANPVAHPAELRRVMGFEAGRQFPANWGALRSTGELYATLYPRRVDVQHCFFLLLCKTGWNPQVALDIDVMSPDWEMPHPVNPDRRVVSSSKSRGSTVQQAISGLRSDVDVYPMLVRLIERTAPLRKSLQDELALLLQRRSQEDSIACRQQVAELQRMIRSPWLAFDQGTLGSIVCLDMNGFNSTPKGRYLRELIQAVNERESVRLGQAPQPIPETLQPTDLRDAFIANGIVASGFNWLVGRILAGHSSGESIRAYIRRRQYRSHSEGQVKKLQNALWHDIENYQIVDAVALNAMVSRGAITDEQRRRWLEGRNLTRMGMGCMDPCHPPTSVDPEHVDGEVCRIQRCILCAHGVVFAGSLDGLTRRLAELEHLRSIMPIAVWLQSSFGDELERLVATLAKFSEPDVHHGVAKWKERILTRQHRVDGWEGAYE